MLDDGSTSSPDLATKVGPRLLVEHLKNCTEQDKMVVSRSNKPHIQLQWLFRQLKYVQSFASLAEQSFIDIVQVVITNIGEATIDDESTEDGQRWMKPFLEGAMKIPGVNFAAWGRSYKYPDIAMHFIGEQCCAAACSLRY